MRCYGYYSNRSTHDEGQHQGEQTYSKGKPSLHCARMCVYSRTFFHRPHRSSPFFFIRIRFSFSFILQKRKEDFLLFCLSAPSAASRDSRQEFQRRPRSILHSFIYAHISISAHSTIDCVMLTYQNSPSAVRWYRSFSSYINPFSCQMHSNRRSSSIFVSRLVS